MIIYIGGVIVSKKINILLFFAIIISVSLPFFEVESGDSTIYISGMSLLPGFEFTDTNDVNYQVIRGALQNGKYYLFYIIPLIEMALMSLSVIFENKGTKAVIFEILCYVINFGGFLFTIFSLKGYEGYDLSFGYCSMMFMYMLAFAFKIFEYLINSTPSEEVLWAKK